MIELESGTIQLRDDRWQHLRRVLEAILPHWIDEASLNGKGIQLFLLQESRAASPKEKDFPAILVLRAAREREDQNPGPMPPEYKLVAEFQPRIYLDLLIECVQHILEDGSIMAPFWRDMERQTNPEAGLGQGDGCFRAYKIAFSNDYYDTFFRLFLAHHFTPA